MDAIAAQTLISEVQCYACFGSTSFTQMLVLALERRILLAKSPTADVSGDGLIAYAKCLGCYGASLFDLLETALLDKIAQA